MAMDAMSITPLYSVEFPGWIRRMRSGLLVLFGLAGIITAFAPWQQSVTGTGRVAAFTPLDRTQSVQAPVRGRVVEVFVTEADLVAEGDPLVRIVDIDPDKVDRIESKLDAARRDLEFTELNIKTYKTQIAVLEKARDLAVDAFEAKVRVAEERLRAAEQKLVSAQAELDFATQQEQRVERLSPEFIEEIKLLEAISRRQQAEAHAESCRADIDGARASLENARAELGKERESANASVEGARVNMQSMSGDATDISAKIADLEGELRAQGTQLVRAPRDGRVFRLQVNTGASIVKEGEVLLQIVPVTAEPAVEFWVRGVDAPLIEPGRKVRLQFEGWPAVQFVGWPSVAVGTFGGVVSLVDPTDSGNGKFRLMVVPDPDDEPWPAQRWLRQGVRAKGWILLDEVRLYFELWRQFNGFPPSVAVEPSKATAPTEAYQR